jgi:hypothetical protein
MDNQNENQNNVGAGVGGMRRFLDRVMRTTSMMFEGNTRPRLDTMDVDLDYELEQQAIRDRQEREAEEEMLRRAEERYIRWMQRQR